MKKYNILFFLMSVLGFFSNCGKHEATGGTLGAASGALVGHAVSGSNSKGTGMLIGALVGNVFGRAVGSSADQEEREEEERHKQVVRRAEKQQIKDRMNNLEAENRVLKKQLRTWCHVCAKKVTIIGANRCPDCGYLCVKEKFCSCCGVIFNPDIRYRYCPYCVDRVILSVR